MVPDRRNIAAFIDPVWACGHVAAGAQINGTPVNLSNLTGNPESVKAVLNLFAELDSDDTITLANIALQTDDSSAFSSPTNLTTASNVTLTGAAANTTYGQLVELDADLTLVASGDTWIRVVATPTLSDTTNTTGGVTGELIFGGQNKLPNS